MIDSTAVWLLFWLLPIPVLLAAVATLWAGWRYRSFIYRWADGKRSEAWTPPVTLIVPVKGLEAGLEDNIRSLAAQDYPDFELLIAARGPDDPAAAQIRPLLPPNARIIFSNGVPENTGEKIQNLLAAVAAARPDSKVLAFADSDGRASPGWLRSLVTPLADGRTGASTGYRWYFPASRGFWSLYRSVWNSVIAGGFTGGHAPFAWGGAMALTRLTFTRARVAEFWRGSLSDDYRLTEAVRAAGMAIRFTPGAMVETEGDCSREQFFPWAVRQLTITRIYRPGLWWAGFAAHVWYCGVMLLCAVLLLESRLWAIPILLLTMVPGMFRGELRRQAAEAVFPERAEWFRQHGWSYSLLALPGTWIWLAVFLRSMFGWRIEWRGNIYELHGRSETRIVAAAGGPP